MDFDKLAFGHHVARHTALGAEGRDEGDQRDEACIGHEFRHLRDAPDIFDAVSIGEPKIAVEAVAYIVAVEQIGVATKRGELLFENVGDGGFARSRQSCEPEHCGLLPLGCGARLFRHVHRLPVDIGRTAQRKVDQPHANRGIG